jgi:DNA (cytosine-5)-methyltransferase 1
MPKSKINKKAYTKSGTKSDWYVARDLSENQRVAFQNMSILSARKKKKSKELLIESFQKMNVPLIDPNQLMPQRSRNDFTTLSLFSGGGGMDLGFDSAGFSHKASYELLEFAGDTIKRNRPNWAVHSGSSGDVTEVDWSIYKGSIDVVHGGPPCQPFSTAGRQAGVSDPRDMVPEFVRCILECDPKVFVMENVTGLLSSKFQSYVNDVFLKPLKDQYSITTFELSAADFGVPQKRRRVFFVGTKFDMPKYFPPRPTHINPFVKTKEKNSKQESFLFSEAKSNLPETMGVRHALGLACIGVDQLAPTIRCTLTGPRGTTSILSSTSSSKIWDSIGVWANGVAKDRASASKFETKNGNFRLSVDDVALLQGFPTTWKFEGAVSKSLGQIGNSVAPPMAYAVALSILEILI